MKRGLTIIDETTSHLDALRQAAQNLERDRVPEFIGALEAIKTAALLQASAPPPEQESETDRLIDVRAASLMCGISIKTLYKREFPFTRRVGSRRLFSFRGIQQFCNGNNKSV